MSQPRFRTLAESLAPAASEYSLLRKRYKPLIELATQLLGVAANCYPYLEIWPPGFRSYNIMLPNFMGVPLSLFGVGASIRQRGLGMYVSSRTAECMYCSAHCCAVSLRGGLEENKILAALDPDDSFSPGERAVVTVARGMSTVPATLKPEDVHELRSHYSEREVDGLMLPVAMMGFLNKMMDACGFNLERGVVEEVERLAAPSGWSAGRHQVATSDGRTARYAGSTARLWLGMLPHMPQAARIDARWTRGVPASGADACALLNQLSGYEFPMVRRLYTKRIIRALTTMLRDNLIPETSELSLGTKHLVGVLYATGLFSDELATGSRLMAEAVLPELPTPLLDALTTLGQTPLSLDDPSQIAEAERSLREAAGGFELDDARLSALLLTKTMTTSPAVIPPALIEHSHDRMSPAAVVELMTWISILSLLHRLNVFQQAGKAREEGLERGLAEGREEGQRRILLKQLQLKFGAVSNEAQQQVEAASSEQLLVWSERVLTANTLKEVLGQ